MPTGRYGEYVSSNFVVNIDAVTASMDRFSHFIDYEAYRLEGGMRSLAKQLLIDKFEDAVRGANAEDGFPEEFQDHVMRAVRELPIYSSISSGDIFISVDFDLLGDWEDLKKAFHQGARLAGGGFVDGPYNGEELANEDAGERHIFWEAVQAKLDSAPNPKGAGRIPIEPGAWEKTKKKYVDIWGEQAPEWLYVQFGQDQWSPTVPAQNVMGDFEQDLYYLLNNYLRNTLAEELRILNNYQTAGTQVGFTTRGSARLLGSGNTLTVNGKTYKAGQFIPKNTG